MHYAKKESNKWICHLHPIEYGMRLTLRSFTTEIFLAAALALSKACHAQQT
jgi:hypothetical protein